MIEFEGLISGYNRFKTNEWHSQREKWQQLQEGQSPNIMVIACSDSRVEPSQIFDTSPGEIFVVRNVAALVPPYEIANGYHGVSAALEFAVTQLGVSDVMVMGHGQCGGCNAALNETFKGAKPGEGHFIAHWINMLDSARDAVKNEYNGSSDSDAQMAMEFAAVKTSLANLLTFPFVKERVDASQLKLHGAHFGIELGALKLLNPHKDCFEDV